MVDKDRVKKLLDKVYRLNYWFCNEMLTEEQHMAEFEDACKKATESGEPVIMISAASGNAQCMKNCMKDTVEVINFLRNKENLEYLEPWQLAGAEAMFRYGYINLQETIRRTSALVVKLDQAVGLSFMLDEAEKDTQTLETRNMPLSPFGVRQMVTTHAEIITTAAIMVTRMRSADLVL